MKSLTSDFIRFDKSADEWIVISNYLEDMSEHYNLAGIIFLECLSASEVKVLTTARIEEAPLKSRQKSLLLNTVYGCLSTHPEPHIHTISKKDLEEIESINSNIGLTRKVLFLPFEGEGRTFIFLGMLTKDGVSEDGIRAISSEMKDVCLISHYAIASEGLSHTLSILEEHVKEIGHDFASSIQSAIAKIKGISRGRYEGVRAKNKAREAEEEIWSAQRIAQNLGFAFEPFYKPMNPRRFSLDQALDVVKELYKGEAVERHIEVVLEPDRDSVSLFGDQDAIKTAIGHYIHNAVKYAFGSTQVFVDVRKKYQTVEVVVKNKGVPIDPDEHLDIWAFGTRGRNAHEYHVNGSGIGLHTVKKIVTAHGGHVESHHNNEYKVSVFNMVLPLNYMEHETLI